VKASTGAWIAVQRGGVADAAEDGGPLADGEGDGDGLGAADGARFQTGTEASAGSSPSKEKVATYFASTGRPFCVAGAYVDDTAVSIAAAVSRLLVIETIVTSSGVPFAAIVSRTSAVPV